MIHGHGDDAYLYAADVRINFSSNVHFGVDHSGLWEHLRESTVNLSAYPEPDAGSLARCMAAREGVAEQNIVVTNGATEAFYLIAAAFSSSRSLIVTPCFSEYGDACRMYGHRIVTCCEEKLAERMQNEQYDLIWLCSPSNPEGKVFPYEKLRLLIGSFPASVFVIDQAYEGFTERRRLSTREACAAKNVLLIHSLTKRYAIAGLRLGFVSAHEALLQSVAARRMPWTVNSLAIEAGKYICANPERYRLPLAEILSECQRLRKTLSEIEGIYTQETDCHFFSACLAQGTAAKLKKFLLAEHGILIRDASNFDTLTPGHFRICSRSRPENDQLINAIRQWNALNG